MPRTWSNVRFVDETSAAQRARSRRAPATPFVVLMVLTTLLFLGITAFGFYTALVHPVTEVVQPAVQPPKVE